MSERCPDPSSPAARAAPGAASQPPGAAGAGARPARTPRHNEWTTARMSRFLVALARERSVAAAARRVGMGRQSAYKLRARLAGTPFAQAWDVALSAGMPGLARLARAAG